jgi:hypothetical protein
VLARSGGGRRSYHPFVLLWNGILGWAGVWADALVAVGPLLGCGGLLW